MKEKIKVGYYELGNSFSKQLKNLIVEILQFDPDERPSISKIMANPWMEKMKKQIKGEVGKIQNQLQAEISNRAKVEKQKGSGKKHKRFDSLANEHIQHISHKYEPYVAEFLAHHAHAGDRTMNEDKKKAKKKCKTQGEESMEKRLTEAGQTIEANKYKWKKENSQVKLMNDLSKTAFTMKGENAANLKMKRIAQKLS